MATTDSASEETYYTPVSPAPSEEEEDGNDYITISPASERERTEEELLNASLADELFQEPIRFSDVEIAAFHELIDILTDNKENIPPQVNRQ